MLRKLLKYDLKSLFKYWWFAAAAGIAISVSGGFGLNVLTNNTYERELPAVIYAFSAMILFFSILALSFVTLASTVLIFIRFYKNLFSDEGYLTFTLPVKRSTLLNSKILSSTILDLTTYLLLALCLGIILVVGLPDFFINADTWHSILDLIIDIIKNDFLFASSLLLELLLIFVAMIVYSILFLYTCITFGSIITKKYKVIAAIGIYYAVNSIVSFALQIFYSFSFPGLISSFAKLSGDSGQVMILLSMLVVFLFISAVCVILYILQYWMLDRKLNLA